MLQRSSPLYGLPRAARREIELLLATDPDAGDGIEQETFILENGSLNFADQLCLKQMFAIGFRGLTPREERVLRMRYGLAGVGCHTYKEIADEFDNTVERIRQVEMRAHQPVPHVPVPHVPAPDLAGIPEEILAAALAEPAASRALPRPSLWSRIWNWVPGGRVGQGECDLDSIFSSRRR